MSEPVLVKKITPEEIVSKLERPLNIEHLKTMYSGDLSHVYAELNIIDPRKVRPKQRALFFATLQDIWDYTGQPKDDLKDYFYFQYAIKTFGQEISLADDTSNTVSDANDLLNIVVDYMFEFNIPFKAGFELLPRDESYFLYNCCKYRKCMICGKDNSQMAHFEAVGSEGRNRADHRNKHFWCLCQDHHTEQHNLGVRSFMNKYHIKPIKLGEQTLKNLHVMTQKQMDRIDQERRQNDG